MMLHCKNEGFYIYINMYPVILLSSTLFFSSSSIKNPSGANYLDIDASAAFCGTDVELVNLPVPHEGVFKRGVFAFVPVGKGLVHGRHVACRPGEFGERRFPFDLLDFVFGEIVQLDRDARCRTLQHGVGPLDFDFSAKAMDDPHESWIALERRCLAKSGG